MDLSDHPGIGSEHSNSFIAGWETERGGWMNTEAGDPLPSPNELEVSPVVVVGIRGDGEATYTQDGDYIFIDQIPSGAEYYTVDGLTPDFDLDDVTDDLEGEYSAK